MLDVTSESLLRAIFHTLAYADVFDYPLTAPEIHRYLPSTKVSLERTMQILGESSTFSRVGTYFTLRGREGIVETRKRRKQVADRVWPKAARYGRLIGALPFVRMVAVTGSLAVDNAEDGKDVDYMIVTAPDRLWTCRALSLLVARFAKLEQIQLCPNYLITTRVLELKERSLYVAHELVQMVPLSGIETYRELLRKNQWLSDYLPNATMSPESPYEHSVTKKQPGLQRFSEKVLSRPFSDRFEHWERTRKIKRLTSEQSHSQESFFSADVCKGHIDQHAENLITALAVRMKETA